MKLNVSNSDSTNLSLRVPMFSDDSKPDEKRKENLDILHIEFLFVIFTARKEFRRQTRKSDI